MIRVTTYTSHPGSATDTEAEIRSIKVEILSSSGQVLAIGLTPPDAIKPNAADAALSALKALRDEVAQVEKELKTMGLLRRIDV